MKEKILEIVKRQTGIIAPDAAAEIEAHIFEFIEWISEYMKPRAYQWLIHSKWMNIEEAYQFWLTNIKEHE